MLKSYETVFILTPVLSEAQMKDAVEKFKDVLIKQNAQIVHEENWGLKKLAYLIDNKTTGFYNLIEFKAAPSVINVLETEYRRDEKVMRFLTVSLDKYALEYAEKRRKGFPKRESSETKSFKKTVKEAE